MVADAGAIQNDNGESVAALPVFSLEEKGVKNDQSKKGVRPNGAAMRSLL